MEDWEATDKYVFVVPAVGKRESRSTSVACRVEPKLCFPVNFLAMMELWNRQGKSQSRKP